MVTKSELSNWKKNAKKEFDHWADSYDVSILNTLLFRRCHLKVIEIIYRTYSERTEPITLLDVGCGTGTLIAMISETNLPVWSVGLDMAEKMCRLGKEKIKTIGLQKLAHFVRADSEHIPFADNSFDIITCSNSFHHYPHQTRVLREMHRVLKPGGKVIIIDGYVNNVIGWFIFDLCVGLVEKSVHHCSIKRIRNRLTAAGFTNIEQEKLGFWAPVLVSIGQKPYNEGKPTNGPNT